VSQETFLTATDDSYRTTMELKRVVVTGLGAITPIGNSVPEYWDGLVKGASGAGPVTHFDASLFRTQFACEVKGLDIVGFFGTKDARKYDAYEHFALMTAEEAFQDSGIDLTKEDLWRCGAIWASGVGGLSSLEPEIAAYYKGDGTPRFSPFLVPKMIGNMPAGYISIRYGLRGPSFSTVAACAASNMSILAAFDQIRMGDADIIFAGGSEATICPSGIGSFSAMRALSNRNDDPEHASRPFSLSRDGFVMGEGGGCLILEELEHAKARGAKIYAEIIGGAHTDDAYHMTAPHPEGLGAAMVMKKAIEKAGIRPEDVDYINAHGTSTKLGDIAEVKAIETVFGEHTYSMNISSTKSMTGHLLGGAGAIEAIACIKAINTGIIPPTINHSQDDVDPELDSRINFTFNKAQRREVTVALSNGFGFGGQNATLVLRKY